MKLSVEQAKFLESIRGKWDQFVRAQTITYLDNNAKNMLLECARVYEPRYLSDLWCNECVCNLMTYVFTQYNKELSNEQLSEVKVESGSSGGTGKTGKKKTV